MDERFNQVAPLEVTSEITAEVTVEQGHPWNWVVIRDSDPNGPTFLDVEAAIKLRDWLNRAIPAHSAGEKQT